MKLIRKSISWLLLLCMILSVAQFPVMAEGGRENIFTEPQMEALAALGVFDKNTAELNGDAYMMRSDFAALMVRLRGMQDFVGTVADKQYFYDVDDDENAKYISTAAALGLMNGKAEGYFAPYDMVTGKEAVITLLRVLGYDAYLKTGEIDAMALAAKCGLLKGITVNEGMVDCNTIYTMIKNSLQADVMTGIAYGEEITFGASRDNDILSEYHNVYEAEGFVTADENTGLERISDAAADGRLKIDGYTYFKPINDGKHYLGRYVKYYYREGENGADDELIYLTDEDNDILTLNSKDIADFSNMQYVYFNENNKQKKADIRGAYIIYNNKAVENGNFDFIPTDGSVTLIDNDDDGKYEVVCIEKCVDYVVRGIDIPTETVYLMQGADIELAEETEARIVNASNGAALNVTGFIYRDVISVARSLDGKITSITVSHDYITGKIEKLIKDNGIKLLIEGKEYSVTQGLSDMIADDKAEELIVGITGRFYINYRGEIAYWESSNKDFTGSTYVWEYGVLAGAKKISPFDNELSLQIYTVANDFEVFKLDSQVVIDSTPYTDMTEIHEVLCRDGENGAKGAEVAKQVIRFRRNKAGIIMEIDKVGDENSGGLYQTCEDYLRYYPLARSFKGKALVDMRTAVISCPSAAGGGLDTSDTKKMAYSSFKGLSEGVYNFKAYKTDANQVAASLVLLAETSTPTLSYSDFFYVLLKVVKEMKPDGETGTKLIYANNDQIIEHFVDEELLDINAIPLEGGGTYKLKVGDAFRRYLFGGEISYIQPIFDNVGEKLVSSNTGSYLMSTSAWAKHGYVKSIDGDMMLCGAGEPGSASDIPANELNVILNTTYCTVYIYNRETKDLRKGNIIQVKDYASAGDDCTRFVMNLREGELTYQFIIYE